MEVTHIEDSHNHVVLGGGQSRSFAIATTAEFVTVLSDALYSDKELAVTREVICNAWDSHISSGITNKAVSITLTETELIIRDFGAGIPDDLIEEIYCTYGESTKRQESATTGGFGLGSKSPFAISETFSVISYHNGKQTTYAVSKGSLVTDGLPELRNIVTIPTTESGVKVTIPISSMQQAKAVFRAIIKVVRNGGIKAEFNSSIDKDVYNSGLISPVIDMNKAEDGYIVTNYNPASGNYDNYNSNKIIYVQYGSVIYPIESHETYDQDYNTIVRKISSRIVNTIVPAQGYLAKIIIKAKDSSLSVAPSREALSYNKSCINELKILLSHVCGKINEIDYDLIHKAVQENTVNLINKYDPALLNTDEEFLKFILDFEYNFHHNIVKGKNEDYVLYTKQDIHFYYLGARYQLDKDLYKKYIEKRVYAYLKSIKQSFWAKQFKRLYIKKTDYYVKRDNTFYVTYNLRKKLLKDMYNKYGKEIFDNLLHTYRDYSSMNFVKHNGVGDKHRQRPYTEKFNPYSIIVAYNRSSIKNWKGFDTETMLYSLVLPKTQKKIIAKDVADFLENLGYTVHRVYDMEQHQPLRAVRQAAVVDPLAPPKPKANRKGYALLSATLTPNFNFNHGLFAEAERTDEPEAVVNWSTSGYVKFIDGFGTSSKLQLLAEYFPKTVVASSAATHRNIRNKYNIKDALFLIKNKIRSMIVDPDFIRLHALKVTLNQYSMYNLLYQIPDIASEFGYSIKANKYSDRDYTLYSTFKDTLGFGENQKLESNSYAIKTEVTEDMGNFDKYLDAHQYFEFIEDMSIHEYNKLDVRSQDVFKNIIRVALKG